MSRTELDEARSILPGLVVRWLVDDGTEVYAGQPVVVTETMKCEQTVRAGCAGVIRPRVRLGEVIEPGEVLFSVDAAPVRDQAVSGGRPPRPLRPEAVLDLVCGRTGDDVLAPWAAYGHFVEYDLDPAPGAVVPSVATGDRLVPAGPDHERDCGVLVGLLTHRLDGHPDGVTRVWIGGDSGRAMGAVSEAECRRIIAAFDLAEELGVPVEWVAVSAGARIAWDTGTETMDWCAAVVARIVTFTQGGGQVVVVVNGVNVGAQSYWNAEATMLGHHRGMLVMVGDNAMVLTGKNALAMSGGGRHESDAHIGGYESVMGPNGQAHHVATDLAEAYRLVFTHHTLSTPRRDGGAAVVESSDPVTRDVRSEDYSVDDAFDTVGDILDELGTPGRKHPFAIRPVMSALVDRDAPVLERWSDQADAAGAVVWDSRLGGAPLTVVGIEARPHRADSGPHWLAGSTLHPEGSRKIARAVNAASGLRPVVVLASLAGFDGSARSMQGRQLEFGAEIARAVTRFEGPLVVVVLGRFHGGAYVVFSKALNPSVRIVALCGTYVSVIGGDSAAEVVFARDLRANVAQALRDDPGADPGEVHRRERDRIAREFDRVHNVERAAAVGSIDEVIEPVALRPTVARLIGVPEQAGPGSDSDSGPDSSSGVGSVSGTSGLELGGEASGAQARERRAWASSPAMTR